jgi:hypothetical protein
VRHVRSRRFTERGASASRPPTCVRRHRDGNRTALPRKRLRLGRGRAHDARNTSRHPSDAGRRRARTPNSPEEDQLRAAIVFTGAGLDATLKQLIRDTLVHLIIQNDQAHKKFEAFAAKRVGTGEIADTKMIARYLVAANPRQQLIEDYVYDLTGSSLQSAQQVYATAAALGIEDADLRSRISHLTDLFTARNQVSHELDLQRVEQPGDRHRRSRPMGPTKTLCNDGFEVAKMIVNAVGALLSG